jgi:enterobactin synthetase component F
MEDDNHLNTGADTQHYLTQLWKQHLNQPRLDAADDFFGAGGSSMQAIEMLMTVSTKFGKEIDYAEFFLEPTVRKLCELLEH